MLSCDLWVSYCLLQCFVCIWCWRECACVFVRVSAADRFLRSVLPTMIVYNVSWRLQQWHAHTHTHTESNPTHFDELDSIFIIIGSDWTIVAEPPQTDKWTNEDRNRHTSGRTLLPISSYCSFRSIVLCCRLAVVVTVDAHNFIILSLVSPFFLASSLCRFVIFCDGNKCGLPSAYRPLQQCEWNGRKQNATLHRANWSSVDLSSWLDAVETTITHAFIVWVNPLASIWKFNFQEIDN